LALRHFGILFFTGIMHGYASPRGPGTDALRGRFWSNYAWSVASLRSGHDGDSFGTNYIRHPLEGAVVGFLEVANDYATARLIFSAGNLAIFMKGTLPSHRTARGGGPA
jgi:hypothetical protein